MKRKKKENPSPGVASDILLFTTSRGENGEVLTGRDLRSSYPTRDCECGFGTTRAAADKKDGVGFYRRFPLFSPSVAVTVLFSTNWGLAPIRARTRPVGVFGDRATRPCYETAVPQPRGFTGPDWNQPRCQSFGNVGIKYLAAAGN